MEDIFFGMVVLVSEIRVGWAPSGSVKLCFSVSLCSQVGRKLSETGLPGSVSISASSSKADITVSVNENNGGLDDLVFSSSLTSESGTLEISSVKVPA